MNKICFGCGIKLQCENKENDGYIPVHKYEESSYCQRCYKIIHYGKSDDHFEPKKPKVIIDSINKDDKFVIFLTDFLNINEGIINLFKQIKKPKLLLISKADLIPRYVKDIDIKNFLKNYYQINEDIKFVSSFNNFGIEALDNYLYRHRIEEAYIVGLSNAGKSNLINKLIELHEAKINKLTTSNTQNTTLDFIRIKISQNLTLTDSPGFILPSIPFLPNKIKGSIKPRVFQMKANETLKIEDIYLLFDTNTSVTLYIPNEFKISKFYKELNFNNELKINDDNDLIIYGLGFINIKKQCKIKTNNLDLSLTEIRTSLFGGHDE